MRRLTATGSIAASADEVFAFLARPANHVRFDTSGMVRGCTDVVLTAAGDVFVMRMENAVKGEHEVANHVVVFEPGAAIGWAPAEPGAEPAGHQWIWRLEADGPDRTQVTLVYDWSRFRDLEMIHHLPVMNADQLGESVLRLAAAIEDRTT